MADTYGVTPADVAAELPGLYPGGFTASSQPTDAQVTALIATADTVVTLRVTDDVAQSPSASDKAAVLAKRYIIEWVKARVARIVYAGLDPQQLQQATDPFEAAAKDLLAAIDALGAQAVGDGTAAAPRMLVAYEDAPRNMVIEDDMLDVGPDRMRMF